MVIVGRGTHLEVREVVKIVNAGTTPYIDRAGHGGATGHLVALASSARPLQYWPGAGAEY